MIYAQGSAATSLSSADIAAAFESVRQSGVLRGKKVLGIIPDSTRSAPMGAVVRAAVTAFRDHAAAIDFMIALGTHPPMSDEAIDRHLGFSAEDRRVYLSKSRILNHAWDNPSQLQSIGTIPAREVEELSGGRMSQVVDVAINKLIFDYDVLFVMGPTFPHEVVGFSGGNKYLFPGIAGAEIINMFHWLGALITNPRIIGTKYTPVRAVVDRAAAMIPRERLCASLVVNGSTLHGIFVGTPEEAWAAASDLSNQLHIVYKDHPFKSVLSCAPTMYDELWTGGKCAYKLEPVVAEGGDLIIYAPHIDHVSIVHGAYIERIGYHVRDYFTAQMDRVADVPLGVVAHSTHVKGVGTYINGIETPRMNVILATGISKEMCAKINLGYRDPRSINAEEWMNREDEGYLYVPKAGEMLYRLKDDPFAK